MEGVYENHPEYQFCRDLYMACHDRHIEEDRLKRDEILNVVTDGAGESTKIPRLQRAHQLQLGPHLQSKSTIIKNKYAIRCLAGQERMCRLSGMEQRITPQLLNFRSRDQDMHRVLKVALQPWPTLVGMKSLIDFGISNILGETYFRADWFCKYNHDRIEDRRAIRPQAVEHAERTNDGPVVPVLECDNHHLSEAVAKDSGRPQV